METLVRSTGPRTRFIGISNFSPKQLDELLASNPKIKPKVHQLEVHPYLHQTEWVARQKRENITVTAYAPLGNTSPAYSSLARYQSNAPPPLLSNPTITAIATERKCTPAQVVLVWNMNRGIAVIPKSSHLYRQKENFEALDKCKLTDSDVAKVEAMEAKWVGRFNNPCAYMRMKCFEGLQADPNAKARSGSRF
jgi:alcohol dehydrogenase (NADP+)